MKAPPTLRTTVVGNPAGPTVFYCHGWPDNSAVFQPLVKQPALAPYRCVLVDLPICDGRDWPPSSLGFSALVVLLAATIRADQERRQDTGPVALVGHDWGSSISALTATEHPELISRLALLDIGAMPTAIATLTSPVLLFRLVVILSYMSVNAVIYLLGRIGGPLLALADALNGVWARFICHTFADAAPDYGRPYGNSRVNFFYWHSLGLFISARWSRMVRHLRKPRLPLLFLWGTPMYHDRGWAKMLQSDEWPRCGARLPASHD